MPMKIAIAGAGHIANVHAEAVRNTGAELVAVVGRATERTREFAARFGIAQYPTVEAMLVGSRVDALVICTPNFLHHPQTIAALEAGLHVMVEKPMAMNAGEAEAMLAASAAGGSQLMVAHCWRFDPEVRWLRDQSSRLGHIVRTKGYGVHSLWGPDGWFTERQFAGGGALADMGIHAIDTVRFLLGDPAPVSVYARIGTYYTTFDVDDTGIMVIEWNNGTSSYIESGWWQPHKDGPEAATQLYGTTGFGELFPTRLELVEDKTGEVARIDGGFEHPRPDHCPQQMYDAQMAEFFDAIENHRIPSPGGDEGLVNMRIVDAAYESARTGEVVRL